MRRSLHRALLPMAILGSVAASCAMAQTWQALTPEGGNVWLVHGVPGGSSRVFAAASNGAFLSTDSGRTWKAHPQQELSGPFATFAPWPARNFAFDRQGHLLRSDDFGDTWQPTGHAASPGSEIPAIAAITSGVIYSDLLQPPQRSVDNGVTFAPVSGLPADAHFQLIEPSPFGGDLTAAIEGGRLYRSIDGGATWAAITTPMSGRVLSIVYLTSADLVVSINGHIFGSPDNGATWTERLYIPEARIARTSSDTPRLVAVNATTCRVSPDAFVTEALTGYCNGQMPVSPVATTSIQSLTTVREPDGGYRVLATDGIHGIVATDPGPGIWGPSNIGLRATQMRGLALDMQRTWSGIFVQPGGVAAYIGPLMDKPDTGTTWRHSLTGRALWIRSIIVDPTTTAEPATSRVYAAGTSLLSSQGDTDSGIWKSANGGTDWTALNAGLPETNVGGGWGGVQLSAVRKVLLDPRSCTNPPATGRCTEGPLQTLFAISEGAGTDRMTWRVIKSVQQGDARWVPASAGLPVFLQDAAGSEALSPVDIDADAAGGTLYLSTFANYSNNDGSPRVPSILSGVFRSTNGGANWSQAATGLPLYTGSATTTRDVFALAAHPRRAGVLWASTIELGSTSSQINKSTDGGDHWTAVGPPMTNCDVRDLQVDSAAPEVIYAAGVATTGTGCLWRSEDAGLTWTPLHGTLPAYAVYDVRQDPQDRRRLVVASDHGVWSTLAPSDRIFTDRDD